MPDLNILMASAAVLLGLLSLWSQLWITRTGPEEKDKNKKKAASLGLFWIYIAILFGMASIASALVSQYWEGILTCARSVFSDISFAFFITSFIMGFANILESTLSMLVKGWKGKTADEFVGKPNIINRNWYILLSSLALLILLFSLLGVMLSQWLYFGYLIPMGIAFIKYIKTIL